MTDSRPALDDLLRLVKDGYEILEIRTTGDDMRVLLEKGQIHAVLVLNHEDASRILASERLLLA